MIRNDILSQSICTYYFSCIVNDIHLWWRMFTIIPRRYKRTRVSPLRHCTLDKNPISMLNSDLIVTHVMNDCTFLLFSSGTSTPLSIHHHDTWCDISTRRTLPFSQAAIHSLSPTPKRRRFYTTRREFSTQLAVKRTSQSFLNERTQPEPTCSRATATSKSLF
jgi:hypothetical protein